MSAILPIVPMVWPDEALSSWVERVTVFYGGDYELGLGAVYARAGRLPVLQHYDVDTDAQARDIVCAWSDTNDTQVPAILDPAAVDTLPQRARLSYCPACWDDDVSAGRQPYVRRRWLRWSVVHCAVHLNWLTAKRPATPKECQHLGWMDVWRSRPHWAKCFDLRYEPQFATLVGFEPQRVQLPKLDWQGLDADLRHFEQAAHPENRAREDCAAHRAILTAVQFAALESLRYKVAEGVVPADNCTDIVDTLRSRVPLWHGTRLISMLIAVEYLRLNESRTVLNRRLASIVARCVHLREAEREASRTET
jgi:hypothetical protein